jgi:hypothetical protein
MTRFDFRDAENVKQARACTKSADPLAADATYARHSGSRVLAIVPKAFHIFRGARSSQIAPARVQPEQLRRRWLARIRQADAGARQAV